MNIKRILTALIGFPLVVLLLIFGNKYAISIVLNAIALICMYEYFRVIAKVAHPIKWVGYFSTAIITIASILNFQNTLVTILYATPIIILILFLHIIFTDMKITFKDAAYTFFGIGYVTGTILFLSLMMNLEKGNIILGYSTMIAWSTDVFAFSVGMRFGKHKFSKISPKKSIEGCIAGATGAVIIGTLYIFIMNKFANFGLEKQNIYILFGFASLVLSVISQIGDFAASSIKRFADEKDYGTILPGHGGMLDRIDSLIFIAPFVYMLFSII